ncbi:MAG: hypothetical protein ACAI25_18925 [Planctomycetota bacterium]
MKTDLMGTNAFSTIDVLNARFVNPTLATLKTYDIVLTWTGYGVYANSTDFGNNLADFYDAGGRVVVTMFGYNWGLNGRWSAQGYNLIQNGSFPGTTVTSHSLVAVEAASPLLAGVTSFSESTPTGLFNEHSTAQIRNGGIVVANWNTGNPFIIRGVKNGRARVDLNIYLSARDEFGYYNAVWTTDAAGVLIVKNALLFH